MIDTIVKIVEIGIKMFYTFHMFFMRKCLFLSQAMDMLSNTQKSLPIVFLITDGAVEDERRICTTVRSRISNMKSISPRIHTFGIGN